MHFENAKLQRYIALAKASYSMPPLNIYGILFNQFRNILNIFPCYFAYNYPFYAIPIGQLEMGTAYIIHAPLLLLEMKVCLAA